jgi:hypothetical protein
MFTYLYSTIPQSVENTSHYTPSVDDPLSTLAKFSIGLYILLAISFASSPCLLLALS